MGSMAVGMTFGSVEYRNDSSEETDLIPGFGLYYIGYSILPSLQIVRLESRLSEMRRNGMCL